MDGHEAFIPSASMVLLFWGQPWVRPEGCVGQWRVSFGEQWLLLTPELPVLPTEDPKLLPGAKLMFLTCQSTQGDCNALQRSSHIHRQLFISSQLRTTWNQIQSPTSPLSSLAKQPEQMPLEKDDTGAPSGLLHTCCPHRNLHSGSS